MGSAERPTDDGPGARHEVSLRSRDPVEASAVAARVYHEHRLTILGDHRAFAMSLDAASLGPITLGWLSYDTEIRVDAEPHAGRLPGQPRQRRTDARVLRIAPDRRHIDDGA